MLFFLLIHHHLLLRAFLQLTRIKIDYMFVRAFSDFVICNLVLLPGGKYEYIQTNSNLVNVFFFH